MPDMHDIIINFTGDDKGKMTELSKSKIFLLILFSFSIGIFIASFFISQQVMLGFLIFGFALIGIFWQKKKMVLFGFLLIFFAFGIARYLDFEKLSVSRENSQRPFWESKIILKGVIDKYPDERLGSVYYVLDDVYVNSNLLELNFNRFEWQKVEGKILIKLNKYPRYKYGDLLEVEGILKEPFSSEEFSYKNYLKKDGVYSVVYYPAVKIISENNGSRIYKFLYEVKSKFKESLRQIIPEPNVSFVDGILFGGKGMMPQEISDNFQKTGLTHLIAVSGYNISVLVWFVSMIAVWLFLGPRLGFIFTTLMIFAFVVVTGAEASVVRASVMGFLLALARREGRIYQSLNSIAFAGAVMIFINPFILRWDVGFQLSFLATVGIFCLFPLFEKLAEKIPELLKLKESFLVTLSAQIMVLPILINSFGSFSALSIFANILVLPLIPFAMAFGFVALGVGLVNLSVAKIFAWILWPMTFYVFKVAEIFAKFDFGYFQFSEKLNWVFIAGYYVLVFIIFRKFKNKLIKY